VSETLKRALEGQHILWIENTVSEAQDRYLDFAAQCVELGLECGLLHSRFSIRDRQCNEEKWVNAFGNNGWDTREEKGRILIGTQVLEQSLDIDADFLVTRFCPTDMLLQRLGRLWRHDKTPRPVTARCEAWILAPGSNSTIENPKEHFGATAAVYNPYVLCRSLLAWQGLSCITLPGDIPRLIEATYSDRDDVGAMAQWHHELVYGDKKRWRGVKALQNLARITLSQHGKTLPENKAQTRYSESDNIDVLIIRSLHSDSVNRTTTITLLSGKEVSLPWRRYLLERAQWRTLTATLMGEIVSVRAEQAPLPLAIKKLQQLGFHHCFYLGSTELDEALLRVAILGDTGILHNINTMPSHDKYQLTYRDDIGFQSRKLKEH